VSIASRALKSTVNWIRVCPRVIHWVSQDDILFQGHDDELEAFTLDANKFVSAFRETRSHNARHIYLSALAISPTVSVQYRSRFPQLHLIVMRAFKLDHLLHVLDVYGSDNQESAASIYEVSKVYAVCYFSLSLSYTIFTLVPQCLTLYTRACIIKSALPNDIKCTKLAAIISLVERCNEWDDITALTNHQTIKNHLLKHINETTHRGPDVRSHYGL
jgi:hypothetical protein